MCCPSKGCFNKEDENPDYVCYENFFESVDIAITACPKFVENCGIKDEFVFDKIG